MPLDALGRTLVVLGLLLAALGDILLLVGAVPWFGRFPGDISLERGNFRFYPPIATSLLLSVLLTIVLNVVASRR